MTIIDEVENNLRNACQLTRDEPVLLGISGGPDSLCMLDILQECGYPVVVAHLDHQLRATSAAEAITVQQEAARRGLDWVGSSADVPGYAAEAGLSIEAAARRLRYRFLFEAARKANAQAVGVAHTADDQVETVLMHLIQGSGLRGLRGMPFRRHLMEYSGEIPLVRPLLSVWRKEVLAYCDKKGLQAIDDPSNRDTVLTRNRVRHTLIPMLETFNPQFRKAVWRLSTIVAGELDLNQASLDFIWKRVVKEASPGILKFHRQVWLNLDIGFQRGLLIRAIQQLAPEGGIGGFQRIEDGLELIRSPGEVRRFRQLGKVSLVCEGDVFWLLGPGKSAPEDDFPQYEKDEVVFLDIPGVVNLANGWQVSVRFSEDFSAAFDRARANENPFQAWVDHDEAGISGFQLRIRRPGDRIKPLGLGGRSQKLSDFMINVKMPQRARDHWPLITAGTELVWVPGYRVSHLFRLTEKTRKVVLFSLHKGGEGGS